MPTMKIPRMPTGQTLQVIVWVVERSMNAKNAARMTQTPIGYHQAWWCDGG